MTNSGDSYISLAASLKQSCPQRHYLAPPGLWPFTHFRNNGIRVDDENDLPNSEGLAIGAPWLPLFPTLFEDLLWPCSWHHLQEICLEYPAHSMRLNRITVT